MAKKIDKSEMSPEERLLETVNKQKRTCVRLLKKLIALHWQPASENDKLYIAESAYVTRTGLYTPEFPYKKIDFKTRLPGIYLGHVKNTNPLIATLASLFNADGLQQIENPSKRKIGCVFCAYQVSDLQGLETLIGRLKKLPELKAIIEAEKKAAEAASAEAALVQAKEEELKVDIRKAAYVATYQEIANLVKNGAMKEGAANDAVQEFVRKVKPAVEG